MGAGASMIQAAPNGNGVEWTSNAAETWSGAAQSNGRGERGELAGAFDASVDTINGNAVTGHLGFLDAIAATTGTPTATPTPSPTFSPTFTPTPTPTSSATVTPTATPTPTDTVTDTPTPTSTATFTPSPSPTSSFSPTPTPTGTSSPTPSDTPTPTPTQTPTPSPEPRHLRLFEFALLWHSVNSGEYDLMPDGQIDDKDLLRLIENQ